MKKYLLFSLLSTLLFASIHAQDFNDANYCAEETCVVEESGFYAKALSGTNFLQSTKHTKHVQKHTGYILSGSLGYRFANLGLRVEAEYAVRRNFITLNYRNYFGSRSSFSAMYNSSSIMGNVLWDLPISQFISCAQVQPFVGLGLGSDYKRHVGHYFAWQIIAGVSRPIFENTDLSLEYRMHKGTSKRYTRNVYNHSVGLGLAYNFGDLGCFK